MIVAALQCGQCRDTIFSRTRHDCRTCGCGALFVDGGFDYFRTRCKKGVPHTSLRLDIIVSREELHKDWNTGTDRFGKILEHELKEYSVLEDIPPDEEEIAAGIAEQTAKCVDKEIVGSLESSILASRVEKVRDALSKVQSQKSRDPAMLALGLLVGEISRWRHKAALAEEAVGCGGLCMATDALEGCCETYKLEMEAAVKQRDYLLEGCKKIASCGCQVIMGPCGECTVCTAQRYIDTMYHPTTTNGGG